MIKKIIMTITFIMFLSLLVGCRSKVSGCVDINYCNIFSDKLLAVEKDSKWGYIDSRGKVKIDFQFDSASAFYNQTAIVVIDNQYQLINLKGKTLLDKGYDGLTRDLETGFLWYRVTSKYGLMNGSGKVLSQPLYDHYRPFSEGLSAVRVGSLWGYINQKGDMQINLLYQDAKAFKEGLAAVKEGDAYGYINTKNKTVIPFLYESAGSFDDHKRAIVSSRDHENTYYLIDQKNNILLSADRIFGNGPLYRARTSTTWHLYASNGKKFINDPFMNIWTINGYLVNVEDHVSDRMDYYSKKGKLLYSVTYNQYQKSSYHDGKLYIHSIIGPNHVIYDGSKTYEFDVDGINQIKNDWIVVKSNQKVGIIDFKGKVVIDYTYDELFISYDGYIVFENEGKIGIMNLKGKVIIDALYTNINTNY